MAAFQGGSQVPDGYDSRAPMLAAAVLHSVAINHDRARDWI